jgi:hypothetical protein
MADSFASGLSRPAGAPVPIKLAGQTYLCRGLGLEDWGVVEQTLLAERDPSPVASLGRHEEELAQYPAMRAAMMDRLWAELRKKEDVNRVTDAEVNSFLQTFDGRCLVTWLGLRHDYPQMSMEKVKSLMALELQQNGQAALEDIARRQEQAGGTDALGNSTGRPPASEGGTATREERVEGTNGGSPRARRDSTGDSTTEPSPSATAGPPR